MGPPGRRPSQRRRLAAAAALILGAATLAGAIATALQRPLTGLVALAGLAIAVWLAWHGVLRCGVTRALFLTGAALAVAAVLGMLAAKGLAVALIVLGAGAVLSAIAVRSAFSPHGSAGGAWRPAHPLRRPVLLINPRSGGGKAEQLGIADEARARGVMPRVLDPGDDLATLARRAVAGGADALGMAGGDGSMAVVDRGDPVSALDAFTKGVERRIDLAQVNGRTFVNNVSLGVYGQAVHRDAYRGRKLRTLLGVLPDLVGPSAPPPPVRLTDDRGRARTDAGVVLVSNNPYASGRLLGGGSRPRLDCGRLGIVVIGRPAGEGARVWSARAFEIGAAAPIRAGADGEAVMLEPPIRFTSRPSVLRVRISERHPGVSPSALLPRRARSIVPRLARIAIGRSVNW